LDVKGEKVINEMAKYNFKKIACNHCTGIEAVIKMIELEYPIVKGTGRYGSASDLYIGAGDEVVF
jgi:7,8-dihydropterin-6-yl-methyl-4-(beta-D-ribofuranosyl)aminobenzene 5'-phosphate synthase